MGESTIKIPDYYFIHEYAKEIFQDWDFLASKAVSDYIKSSGNIKPSDRFYPENLVGIDDKFSWMSECEFKIAVKKGTECDVPSEYLLEVDSLMDLIPLIKEKATLRYDRLKVPEKPIFAMDTETTSLSTNVKLMDGRIVSDVSIVGIPLAVSKYFGIYIPLAHTEEDGIENWNMGDVIPFIQSLLDDYNVVFHNAQYDLSVLLGNGFKINPEQVIDTMLLSKLQGDYEFYSKEVGHGLKSLSKVKLKREMLEIPELLGMSKKTEHISFDRLPSSNAFAYGIADAMNTFGLFEHMVVNDLDGRNPYKYQRLATIIVMKSIYYVVSSLMYNLPVDYDLLVKRARSYVYYLLIIKDKMDKLCDKYGLQSVNPMSDSIGLAIVTMMENGYKGRGDFRKYIGKVYNLNPKITKLVSGKEKVVYTMPDDTLQDIVSKLKEDPNIDNSVSNDVSVMINLVSNARSISKDLSTFVAMIHSAEALNDDRNLKLIPISLNLLGTDTFRFSNSKGSGAYPNYISYYPLRTKTNCSVLHGNGLTPGFNFQGMPKTPEKEHKARYKKVSVDEDSKQHQLLNRADMLLKYMVSVIGMKKNSKGTNPKYKIFE